MYKQSNKEIHQPEHPKNATKSVMRKSLLFAKISEPWCKWVNSCCSIGSWIATLVVHYVSRTYWKACINPNIKFCRLVQMSLADRHRVRRLGLSIAKTYSYCIASIVYYRPQMKLRQGNVFTPACDYVHRGVCVSQHAMRRVYIPLGRHPPGRQPPCQTPTPGADHPPPNEMATDTGGTHPTRMHSCSSNQIP